MIKHGIRTSVGQWLKPLEIPSSNKVTYFKEALFIGSKGSSIRALRTKERSGF
jgi:hypothetical protein